jgi:ferredoxin
MTGQEWSRIIAGSICRITPQGTLEHPGLPSFWGVVVVVVVIATALWGLFAKPVGDARKVLGFSGFSVSAIPVVGHWLDRAWTRPWILLPVRLLAAGLFLLVIWAGLAGTPIAGRNLATMLTWNIWWSGVIVSVLFVGSAWCAICPWDFLANAIVRLRVWRASSPQRSLNLKVPKQLRNVWPALALFIGLTWLELGVGITTSPYATAVLALAILLLAVLFVSLFERKAFCQYACPVGRTIGFYSQLAPVELRAANPDLCADCTRLECYYGSKDVDPCPTHLVIGRLKQNTFCTSCGNCARSCPHENVAWRLRSPASEALGRARPHTDEAWFMLVLLALTGFHGITMMTFWESGIGQLARLIGDSGQLIWSFSLGMAVAIAIPVAVYLIAVWLTRWACGSVLPFATVFNRLSFVTLPLAFSYHVAHNLSHLLRESVGAGSVFANPLGIGIGPVSVNERHQQMLDMVLAPSLLAAIQALLIIAGFVMAVMIVRARGAGLLGPGAKTSLALAPVFTFAIIMTSFHLWLLMQPMNMRM